MRRTPPILALAVLTAACGTAAGSPADGSAPPSGDPHAGGHEPSGSGAAPTPHPSAPEGADGTIVLENDFVIGQSGASVGQALEAAASRPLLVSGVLLRDADGGIWACDALEETDPPRCGTPRLWVTGFPDGESIFDPANAEEVGAETRDGVTWIEDQLLFGVVHPAP
jgi:hypothetical protein